MLVGHVGDDEMGVVLGGRDPRVTEQFLHVAHVGTGSKEMRGERVPERVRSDPAFDACSFRSSLGHFVDGLDSDPQSCRRSFPVEEESNHTGTTEQRWSTNREVTHESFRSGITHRHDALLVSFAASNDDGPVGEVDVSQIERSDLRTTKAAVAAVVDHVVTHCCFDEVRVVGAAAETKLIIALAAVAFFIIAAVIGVSILGAVASSVFGGGIEVQVSSRGELGVGQRRSLFSGP